MDPQITVDAVLHGKELSLFQQVLQKTISVNANEREAAVLLLNQCKEQDMNTYCLKLAAVITLCDDNAIRLLSVFRLRDDLTGENWRSFYQLKSFTQVFLQGMLFRVVERELDNAVSLHVCSLIARIASIQVLNGWHNTWSSKVMKFICDSLSGNPSLTLLKRVLQIFAEWSRLDRLLLVSSDWEMMKFLQDTIVRNLREWNPTISLVAFDAAVSYLPHLKRNGDENEFCVMVAGIVGFFNRAMDDRREESIQDGLDILIDLADTQPELLMEDNLFDCLMGIAGKDNLEVETIKKAYECLLVLAERGEVSSDNMGVKFGQLTALFLHQLTIVAEVEGDGVDEEESAYDIGRDGLVRVAAIWGEEAMITQAEIYKAQYGLGASWEQLRAVIATYDAIIEGCTRDKIMSFGGLQKVLGIALGYLKDKDTKVKVAALNLIRTLFHNSLQLYLKFKVEVYQKIHEMMVETEDQEEVEEVAGAVLGMYGKLVT